MKELVLGEELQRGNVHEMKDAMSRLSRSRKFLLDGGEIRYVDTAGLQLLAAFLKAKPGAEWKHATKVLCEQAEALGMTEALRLTDVEGTAPSVPDTGKSSAAPAEDDLCPVF